MRFVIYGDERRIGLLENATVIDVAEATKSYLGGKINASQAEIAAALARTTSLAGFIEGGRRTLDLTRAAGDYARAEGLLQKASDLKLRAPWPGRRIACIGANFAEHIAHFMQNSGKPASLEDVYKGMRADGRPKGFWKIGHEVCGPNDDIVYPGRATRLDYEGEAAIVIGRKGVDIKSRELKDYVWGVVLCNDWSVRDMEAGMNVPLPNPLSFNLMKNFDCSASVGPYIAVEECAPEAIDVIVTVNGAERQRFNTGSMVYTWGETLEYLSADLTLVPGDLIFSGTGKGTVADSCRYTAEGGFDSAGFLQPGDVVEVSSPQLGSLRNRIVAKRRK